MNKLLITLAAILSISCVTVGPNDTYTVDPYGAPMEPPKYETMRPTKDELDPQPIRNVNDSPFRSHSVQQGIQLNSSMMPRIQL